MTVVGEGTAVISIRDSVSGLEASCTVTVTTPVKEALVKRIDISHTNLSMRVGEESVQLTATCYDADENVVENYAGLVWEAAPMTGADGKDVKVVEVSQKGVVTPMNAGSTLITVTDSGNAYAKATCNVTVRAAEIKVTEVRLLPSSKTIEISESFTLTSVVTPEDAEDKSLVYKSSDEKVATVSQAGVVTGVAGGEAVITATAVNGVKGECRITVAEESGITLSDTKITLAVGQEKVLVATVTPEDAPDKTVTWSSSDEEVVAVDAGKVSALKEGTAVITATTAAGKTATCEVTVETGVVDFEIKLVPSDDKVLTEGLMQDNTVKLNAICTRKVDGNEYFPAVSSWKTSDSSIATVDSEGNVTAVVEYIEKKGIDNGHKVTITYVADHKEASIDLVVVKVLPTAVIFTDIPSVDGVEYMMMHGDTFDFNGKVLPEKADQTVKFTATNWGSIDYDTGVFKASTLGLQDVTIVAYNEGSLTPRFTITVEVLPIPVTDLVLNATTLDMTAGAEASLTAEVIPAEASYKLLSWTSSDENVATVDANGRVKAIGAGNAVITVTQAENNISRTCNVTVSEPEMSYKIGDYYYSTGKVSSKPDEDEATYGKVIGVIFSTDNPSQQGDARLAEDYPECTHGYVISTAEYTDKDFGSVSAYNGHKYYTDLGYDANLIVAEDKANGYGNTAAHAALNASRSDYCLMFNQTDGVIAGHSASVSSPSSASTWYVPSYKEMQMINASRDVINEALAAVGGITVAEPHESDDSMDAQRSSDWYWTSTIYGEWYERGKSYDHHKYPFDISRNGWTAAVQSSATCRVRVILAF